MAFHSCTTQIQTKTSRVIPRASGKQDLQRLLRRAEISKTGSQWRPQIESDLQSQPQATGPAVSSIPPAMAELVWNISAAVVARSNLPGVLGQRDHLWQVTSLHVPSLAGQRAVVLMPAQSVTIGSGCHSFPAAGRVFGTVRPLAE